MINVLVSVCATLTVLSMWDQRNGPLPKNLIPRAWSDPPNLTPTAPQATTSANSIPVSAPTPVSFVYQTKSGDTFESIAAEYQVCVAELLAINGFSENKPLGVGDTMLIPENPSPGALIDGVIGAGDLGSEHIVLKHCGTGPLLLTGWRIQKEGKDILTFPQLSVPNLYPNGALNIHSKSGENTPALFYLGIDTPIWSSGVKVSLLDAYGNVHTTYTVP